MGKQILILGVGETGCKIAGCFPREFPLDRRMCESLLFDTDKKTVSRYLGDGIHSLCDNGTLASVVDRLGAENVREWFPCEWEADSSAFAKSMRMDCGANQWRMKAYLSFADYISCCKKTEILLIELGRIAARAKESADEIEIYTVASLVGGTGSALFAPLTLYVKKRLAEMGATVAASRAILVMPSVYDEGFASVDQKIKGRANAYAALRELCAINATAFDGEECNFRIGSERGTPELLFDCQREEYKNKNAAPFDRVVLFDRIPGVNGVDSHCAAIVELMRSLCLSGENTTIKNSNIYEGMSILKVDYSVDVIKNHIVTNQLESYVTRQCAPLHLLAESDVLEQIQIAERNGIVSPDVIDVYASSYLSRCEGALLGEYVLAECDRVSLQNLSAPENDVFECLANVINAKVFAYSTDLIAESIREVADLQNSRLKKADAKKRRLALVNETARLAQIMNNCHNNCKTLLGVMEGSSAENPIITIDGEPCWSLLGNVLKEGDAFLPPSMILFRLCALRKRLKESLVQLNPSIADVWIWEQDALPASFFAVASVDGKQKTRYGRAGVTRLTRFLRDDPADSIKNADDHVLWCDDILTVYDRLKSAFTQRLFCRIFDSVEILIGHYREVLLKLDKCKGSLSATTDHPRRFENLRASCVVGVGSTRYQKRAFLEEYQESSERCSMDDGVLSEVIMGRVANGNISDGDWLLSSMRGALHNKFMSSTFFEMLNEMSALEVVLEYSHNDPELRDRNIFFGKRVSSDVVLGDSYEKNGIVDRVSLILSPASSRYITDECDINDLGDPARIMEDFLSDFGEYNANVVLLDECSDKEFYIRREILGLPLSAFRFFNEGCLEQGGYRAYRTAMEISRAQCTPMWNPELFISRADDSKLPLIVKES